MNLYRIHYATDTGGKIDYFESRDRFETELLDHHLDVMARNKEWRVLRVARAWRKFRGAEDYPRTKKIVKVQRVDNDEWVDVDYEFIAPEVRIG